MQNLGAEFFKALIDCKDCKVCEKLYHNGKECHRFAAMCDFAGAVPVHSTCNNWQARKTRVKPQRKRAKR